ncbi:MAG: phosphoribosylanthranilate isomerase [Flavobacteriaceae bacterium]|nr:phosphoribosylanthranilate isomerase [Flavobacteriaceae bacterium]
MKIKVCGMRDSENISGLLNLKPDFIGFIFYAQSKRFVTDFPQIEIPFSTKKVGVFVNETIDEIIGKVIKYKLDFVQLHGNETPEYCEKLIAIITVQSRNENKLRHSEPACPVGRLVSESHPIGIIKAFSIDEDFNFDVIQPFEKHVSLFLFDTKGKNYGGNGVKFNWDLLQNYKGKTPFLLSGGISKEDVFELRKIRHPAFLGVDINSGFELEPGLKNVDEIKEFKSRLI